MSTLVFIQEASRCGWLYRVIQTGVVSVSMPLQLIERAINALTVREVCELYFGTPLDHSGLLKLKQQKKTI